LAKYAYYALHLTGLIYTSVYFIHELVACGLAPSTALFKTPFSGFSVGCWEGYINNYNSGKSA